MTLRRNEGFDWLLTSASSATVLVQLQQAKWFLNNMGLMSLVAVTAGATYAYGNALQWTGTVVAASPSYIVHAAEEGNNSAGGWLSASIDRQNSASDPMLVFYDGVNNVPLVSVSFSANGVAKVFVGTNNIWNSTPLGTSEPGSFPDNGSFDVEVFGKINSSTGEVEVRVAQTSILHLINVNTQPGSLAYFDSYAIGVRSPTASNPAVGFLIDNFRHYDTAGSINNTWLGTSRVQTDFINADATPLDFTRSNTGLANWQNINNQNIDDTLYLFDSTVSNYSLFSTTPLVNSPTVFGVQITGFYRQDDATQRHVKNRISSSGTQADGASYATLSTYTADDDMFELDPHTGLSFTGAAVNALLIGPLDFS